MTSSPLSPTLSNLSTVVDAITHKTILIVDDNTTNLEVLSEALENHAFTVAMAMDGESALEQVQYIQPDLILLDVMMPPGIDGFETCIRLQSNPATQEIPIIFMTALADPTDKVKGLSLGAVDYITKPFQQEEVIARVNLHMKLNELNKTVASHNQLLEKRVLERTRELSQALEEMKLMQVQLVHSEKMSSIGQLLAGVAHEINNPLGAIMGNLPFLEEGLSDLINHLRLYQEVFPQPGDRIQENAAKIELEHLSADLPKILESLKAGSDRICTISGSLRTYSRSDNESKVKSNLHDGLESTIMLLRHRFKPNNNRPEIQILREYGEIPLIECFVSQMNQVFMNLLANAIDAMEEANEQLTFQEIEANPNKITIRTCVTEAEEIQIAIADNGPGMSPEVQQRIFDTFFTTKPIGKGTGMGLPISYKIVVEKHNGTFNCFSTPGQGTEFVIRIPIQQRSLI